MSRWVGRVNQLWKSTHTFVRPQDWKRLLDYWRAPLDDANVKPEDFYVECDDLRKELEKIVASDVEKFRVEIQRLAAENRLAYCTLMYQEMHDLSQSYPKGYWAKNSYAPFLKVLRDSRQRAKRLKR